MSIEYFFPEASIFSCIYRRAVIFFTISNIRISIDNSSRRAGGNIFCLAKFQILILILAMACPYQSNATFFGNYLIGLELNSSLARARSNNIFIFYIPSWKYQIQRAGRLNGEVWWIHVCYFMADGCGILYYINLYLGLQLGSLLWYSIIIPIVTIIVPVNRIARITS